MTAKHRQVDVSSLVGPWSCERSYLDAYTDGLNRALSERPDGAAAIVTDPTDPNAAPLYEVTASGVALVSLAGPLLKRSSWMTRYLGGTSTAQVRKGIDMALADPAVSGIVVVADTPGGMHAGTAELASTIRAASRIKPTFAYAEDLAASAGLWSIVAASQVFANEAAIVGSIGTYMVVYDQSAAYAAGGVKVYVISSAPPIKGAGVPGAEVVPEQLAAWRKTVTQMSDMFVRQVANYRDLGISDVKALATGDVWSAEEAKTYGLVDGIMSLSEVIDLVRKEKSPMSKSISVPGATAPAAASTPAPAPVSETVTQPSAAAETPAPPVADSAPTPAPESAAPQPTGILVTAEEFAALRARAEVAERDASEARARAASLEQAERSRRFGAVASTLGLPTSAAPVLDRIEAAMGPEVFSSLESLFSGLRTQQAHPEQFTEIGTAAAATESGPGAQLVAIANQLVTEGKAKDFHAAYAMAVQLNPSIAANVRPSTK